MNEEKRVDFESIPMRSQSLKHNSISSAPIVTILSRIRQPRDRIDIWKKNTKIRAESFNNVEFRSWRQDRESLQQGIHPIKNILIFDAEQLPVR